MLWEDIELARPIPDALLVRALAAAFETASSSVAVVDDVEALPRPEDRRRRILLERWPQPGQFPLHLRIYLRDPDLRAQVAARAQSIGRVQRLCVHLDCDCLISDDDVNPYGMLLVRRTGLVEPVRLDGDALERDEYVLVSASASLDEPRRVV